MWRRKRVQQDRLDSPGKGADVAEATPTCPWCGGKVGWRYDCHTWKQGERWMSCLPCDSAVEYYCREEGCDWCYTHGLNTGNPRWLREQEFRPGWLPEALPVSKPVPGVATFTWVHPGVE